MGLKAELENLDGVEEAFHSLYTEKDGKFLLTGVEGMVPSTQIATLKTEAGKYRIQLKDANTALDAYKALGVLTEVQEKLDKFPELELAAAGKLDDKKLNEMVEARLGAKLTPVVRERDQYKTQVETLTKENDGLKGKEKQRTLAEQVRTAATTLKLLPEAVDDAIMYGERILELGEDGIAVVKDQGLSVKDWLTDMQLKRPHWWGASVGGGAGGGKMPTGHTGPNPFTFEHWNMTEQGKLVRSDRKVAERLAAAAGTSIGGAKPAAKAK